MPDEASEHDRLFLDLLRHALAVQSPDLLRSVADALMTEAMQAEELTALVAAIPADEADDPAP